MLVYCCKTGQSCVTTEGWTGVSDHIYSNKGNRNDAYLVLNLDVDGFVGKAEFVNGKPLPVGTVSFVFETSCTKDCTFLFMQVTLNTGCFVKNNPFCILLYLLRQWSNLHKVTFHLFFRKHITQACRPSSIISALSPWMTLNGVIALAFFYWIWLICSYSK